MSEDQAKTLSRLLNKLTAVRATLKSDERALLDTMVVNARIAMDPEEVATHAMGARKIEADEAATEVAAHAMEARPIAAEEAAVQSRAASYFSIAVDKATESYRVVQ